MTWARRWRTRPRGLILASFLCLAGSGLLLAQANIEHEARAIDAMLIAPCCFSQQVSVHQSPVADQVRRDVRARLAAGQTRQQILDAYVAQYGTRVLAEPPATGVNVALYVTPVAVFLASLALVVLVLRRFNRHPTPALPEGGQPRPPIGSPADEARLDDELRDLD